MTYILIPLIVGALTPLCFALIQKSNAQIEQKMSIHRFQVRISIGACWGVSVFTAIISLVWILLNLRGGLDTVANMIIIPVFLLLYLCCYVCIREELIVDGNTLHYTPAFGKKRCYAWCNIKQIKIQFDSKMGYSYIVYDQNARKMFTLSDSTAGTKLFLKRAQTENILCIR